VNGRLDRLHCQVRLSTSPIAIGSAAVVNTIGIAEVAALATNAAGVLVAAITVTRRRTRSAASTGSRSYWPSAQRYSIATFRPSKWPDSFRPRRNASKKGVSVSRDLLLR
jgi:hypothetical protein